MPGQAIKAKVIMAAVYDGRFLLERHLKKSF